MSVYGIVNNYHLRAPVEIIKEFQTLILNFIYGMGKTKLFGSQHSQLKNLEVLK